MITKPKIFHEKSLRKNRGSAESTEAKLYKYARNGNWKRLVERCSSHPHEAKFVYNVKSSPFRSTALHEVCKDVTPPPPLNAVIALTQISSYAASIQDGDGWTPLHHACKKDQLSVIVISSLVTSFPWALSVQDNHRKTPLHYACEALHDRESCVDVVKSLLSFISISSQSKDHGKDNPICMEDDRGWTPLHIIFSKGICRESVEIAKMMIESCPDIGAQQDKNGMTPLHMVCDQYKDSGTAEMSKIIADFCPEAVLKQDINGRTPLHVICDQANGEILDITIKILVNFSSLQAFFLQDKNGYTPLHLLFKHKDHNSGDENKVKSIVMNIIQAVSSVYCQDKEISHYVIYQVDTYHVAEVIEIISKSSLVFPVTQDQKGMTLLHHACLNIHHHETTDIIELLINCFPGSVLLQDNSGMTALHALCKNPIHLRSQIAMEILLKKINAKEIIMKDVDGNTALHFLCNSLHHKDATKMFETILKRSPRLVFEQNMKGETPLHLVCKQRHMTDIVEPIKQLVQICPFIASVQDDRGRTPIHVLLHTCKNDHSYDVLQLLAIACPEAITKTDDTNCSPLSLFCEHNIDKMEELTTVLFHMESSTSDATRNFIEKLSLLMEKAYFPNLDLSLDDKESGQILRTAMLVLSSYYSQRKRDRGHKDITFQSYVEPLIDEIIQLHSVKIQRKDIAIKPSRST